MRTVFGTKKLNMKRRGIFNGSWCSFRRGVVCRRVVRVDRRTHPRHGVDHTTARAGIAVVPTGHVVGRPGGLAETRDRVFDLSIRATAGVVVLGGHILGATARDEQGCAKERSERAKQKGRAAVKIAIHGLLESRNHNHIAKVVDGTTRLAKFQDEAV